MNKFKRQNGQTMVEFGLIAAVIAVLFLGILMAFATPIGQLFKKAADSNPVNADARTLEEIFDPQDETAITYSANIAANPSPLGTGYQNQKPFTLQITSEGGGSLAGIPVKITLGWSDRQPVIDGAEKRTDTKETAVDGTVTFNVGKLHSGNNPSQLYYSYTEPNGTVVSGSIDATFSE